MKVTDIHVSRYRGLDRAPELKKFCDTHLALIKPKFVIASGDLTDAKFNDLKGSKQFIDEWQTYHNTIKHCQDIVNVWLDLRGNHDAFDTPDLDHRDNLFRQYSSQGKDHSSSYIYHHTETFGKYSIVAVDASPNPGPKRPFNFFGYIKSDGEKMIENYLNESRTSNMTIAFGHYPTSLIATQTGNNIRHILRNVTAYLCGHLHTLARIVPNMYARHKTGMLELELGDWRDERLYRILAVDHDMLSIVDAVKDKWPVVMVTNPKEASLIAPLHEPLYLMNQSTHIRILVFTNGNVNNIEVYIDDKHQGKAQHSDGPLFVLPWQPSLLSPGVHSIRVVVQDSVNGRHVTQQSFSLDETSPLLPFKGRFILMMDIAAVAQTVFFLTVTVYVFVLILLRKCNNIRSHLFTVQGRIYDPLLKFYNNWLHRVWLVTQTTKLFYSVVGAALYVTFGPWLIGEILEGHTGIVFVWGMFVNGSYLPVCLTYFYGLFQLITFNIPLTMCLGYNLHYLQGGHKRKSFCHRARHIYFPFLSLLVFQTYIALSEFPAAYGTRALVLGPVRTGSVILAVVLFLIARKTNVNSLVCSHTN
ncbi:transmembrane protein 62-like isoform X2 [Ruditapes philippinarum]|uniref:transmembrane protein 62-like isoform X2 n=1 Tax=Ruditapes philippinarum TaxID=129788 RepID=UPI00295BB866|nr:transmembrane protein 62-like isoform X2 [Ruditapes philippinarum]